MDFNKKLKNKIIFSRELNNLGYTTERLRDDKIRKRFIQKKPEKKINEYLEES